MPVVDVNAAGAKVEALETEALRNGRLLSDDGIVRYFWHEFDRNIGAACGEGRRRFFWLNITSPVRFMAIPSRGPN